MKRHKTPDSRLPSRGNCLGHTCGTNIDTEGIDFTNPQSNLVYMDKVFSFNKDTASPLLFNLNTGGVNTNYFTTELILEGCSLIPCTLSSNAVFEIDNTFVVVEYFNTRPPGNINASQVSLDGFPVDSVSYSNGQYTAKTANILPRVQKERCLDKGLPTKAFFLINNAGPWDFRATYVLEGTVNTDGRICRFRAEISNAPNSSNTSLPNGSLSSFAIPDLSLPCSINGIAPDILFQFNAKINLVNPRLVVHCGTPPPVTAVAAEADNDRDRNRDRDCDHDRHCCCPCPDISPIFTNSCTVSLVTTIAVEPVVHVETVRKTLFCVNACEGLQPCQGSVLAAEIEDDEEECIIGGIDRPDCRCGNNNNVRGTSTCNTNLERGCGNRDIGGVTVGAGTCEDCVGGDRVRGDRDHDRVRSIRDCEDILREICEELLGDTTCSCDVRGVRGFAPDGTFGCDCEEVRGIRDRDRNDHRRHRDCDREDVMGIDRDREKSRTAFQFNGCNGCSW